MLEPSVAENFLGHVLKTRICCCKIIRRCVLVYCFVEERIGGRSGIEIRMEQYLIPLVLIIHFSKKNSSKVSKVSMPKHLDNHLTAYKCD